jgi:hypothetical protein
MRGHDALGAVERGKVSEKLRHGRRWTATSPSHDLVLISNISAVEYLQYLRR